MTEKEQNSTLSLIERLEERLDRKRKIKSEIAKIDFTIRYGGPIIRTIRMLLFPYYGEKESACEICQRQGFGWRDKKYADLTDDDRDYRGGICHGTSNTCLQSDRARLVLSYREYMQSINNPLLHPLKFIKTKSEYLVRIIGIKPRRLFKREKRLYQRRYKFEKELHQLDE